MSALPDMVFEKLGMYLHDAPVHGTLPSKTLNEKRPDRMYWGHDSGALLGNPVVIMTHVREDLLVVVRNGFAEEHVHLSYRTSGRRWVDGME